MDTIAALATTPGEAGIAIVRISGDHAADIFTRFFVRRAQGAIQPNHLYYGDIVFAVRPGFNAANTADAASPGAMRDSAMAVLMRAPHSYTREDVCEFHVHGGQVLVTQLLRALFLNGARPAEPGEFTRRAFLNGRIDLAQAEAVMRILGASGEAALRAGTRQLEGGLSRFVAGLQQRLTDVLAGISALLDFPDEIDEQESAANVAQDVLAIRAEIANAIDERTGRILEDGISAVLVGKPNVGKSSLMNALLDRERAIVTEIPGTTRDVLTETIHVHGVEIHLSDTAGQHAAADPVEAMGIARARSAMDSADLRLIVLDSARPLDAEDIEILSNAPRASSLVLLNKSDLPEVVTPDEINERYGLECLNVSAARQVNIDSILEWIGRASEWETLGDSMLTSERHIACARAALGALEAASAALVAAAPLDLVAIDITDALDSLAQITNLPPEHIARIFERFCVGK